MKRDMLTGRTLGEKYRLGSRVELPTAGHIYQATQLSLDREVAIEVIDPASANSTQAAARLRQDVSAVSRLHHPRIITVLDWGQERDGLLYLVTESLAGSDLLEIARREAPLPPERIARLMEQVAWALAHAHDHGVVYRGLTPETIRVVRYPSRDLRCQEFVKIAWTADIPVRSTLYMSPEQASGGVVCPESDLYACGVILFLLATGRLPFSADSPFETARMHVHQPVPMPSDYHPQIDPRLERIILRCLEKRPSARPASATALAGMLSSISDDDDDLTTVRHGSTVEGGRPSRLLWTIGAASALLAFASAYGLSARTWPPLRPHRAGLEVQASRQASPDDALPHSMPTWPTPSAPIPSPPVGPEGAGRTGAEQDPTQSPAPASSVRVGATPVQQPAANGLHREPSDPSGDGHQSPIP